MFSVVAFAVLTPSIEAGTGFSTAKVATIASVYFLVFAFAQLAAGNLIDRWGARKVLTISAIISTVGGVAFAVSSSFIVLLLARGVMGLGLSAAFVGAIYVARTSFHESKFAFMSGLVQFAANIGGTVGSIAVASLEYSSVILLSACANLAIAGLLLVVIRRPALAPTASVSAYSPALRSRNVWLGSFFFAGTFGTLVALADFWAVPMLDRHGHDLPTIGLLNAMLPAGTAIGALAAGWAASRFGRVVPLCRFVAGFSLVCTAVFVLQGEASPAVAGSTLFILGVALGGAILAFVVADRGCPEPSKGTAIGLVNTIGYAGAGLTTIAIAALDSIDHSARFIPIIALSATAVLASILMRDGCHDSEHSKL